MLEVAGMSQVQSPTPFQGLLHSDVYHSSHKGAMLAAAEPMSVAVAISAPSLGNTISGVHKGGLQHCVIQPRGLPTGPWGAPWTTILHATLGTQGGLGSNPDA